MWLIFQEERLRLVLSSPVPESSGEMFYNEGCDTFNTISVISIEDCYLGQ